MSHRINVISKNSERKIDSLLFEHYLAKFRKGFVEVSENKYCVPIYYQELAERLDNFEVRDSDVFVASFPKTGTTWTQEMVWCITNQLDLERAKVIISDRVPFLELTMMFDYRDTVKEDPTFKVSAHLLDSFGYIARMDGDRIIKTHLPWEMLPKQIRDGTRTPKIIYVTRNPKDTCLSYYYHARSVQTFTGSFEQFVEIFLEGRVLFGPYDRHLISYHQQNERENLLIIRYEDMKKDLGSVIRRVAQFLGKSINEEQIEILKHHLSFKSMKDNPAVNYEWIHRLQNFKFMRVGEVGSYKMEMSPEIIEKLNEWSKLRLEKYGIIFSDNL